jgi:hypothetical protein
MDIHEIVKKLLGPIKPVGETNTDEKRLDNLSATLDLIDCLLEDVQDITRYKDSHEYSRAKAGKKAADYLRSLLG